MNQKAWDSGQRAAQWILAKLNADGSLQGGTDLRAYYKTPAGLIAAGHFAEANLILDHVERQYLQAGGDLLGEGVPWFPVHRTYPHSWLCCGAAMAGRFPLVRQLSDFLASYHNPSTGGFHGNQDRTFQDVLTTSMAGIASIWSGQLHLALAAGGWLQTLWKAQPDLQRGLYTNWSSGLVTTYPPEEASAHLVDAAKPKQWYFQYGIAAAFLTSLSGATGDAHWLALAREILHASAHCAADRYQTPQSGKVGWGAAWTYRLSHNPADLELAATVTDGLCALQNDDGSWLASGVYGGKSVPADSVTIDVTSEFVALQSFMGLVPVV